MVNLRLAVFLRETAELVGGELACTPADPLMIATRKEKGQIVYHLNNIAKDYHTFDGRFGRLFILAQRLDGARKEVSTAKFGIQERRRWRKDLLDLADNLDGTLPWRFHVLRDLDHPTEVVLTDTATGRKTYTHVSKLPALKGTLTDLFGGNG